MTRFVITGGAGFIGSHVVDHFVKCFPDCHINVLDKLTYAADERNLSDALASGRVALTVGDITSLDTCRSVVRDADVVINLAAESHVDLSFGDPLHFTETNTYGSHCLAEACRSEGISRFLHVSTDEVYGEVPVGMSDEETGLNPTNPYSASKAAAEMILMGYLKSFGLDLVIVRSNNVVGTRQFPDKILSRFICRMLEERPVPIHGTGKNRRCYLLTTDFCHGLELVVRRGRTGHVYNIGSDEEYTNLEVAELVCKAFERDPRTWIEFVTNRPFNDSRYSVDTSKIRRLGWARQRSLATDIPEIISWYRQNSARFLPLDPEYMSQSVGEAVKTPKQDKVTVA